MRHIGSIQQETDAKRFGDYLLAAGMKNHVEEGSSGWAIWVEDDDKLDAAKVELESFQASPADGKYNDAARQAKKILSHEEKKQERLRKHFRDVRTTFGAPQQWAQPITMGLILISLLVAAATALGSNTMGPAMNALRIQSVEVVDEQHVQFPPGLEDVARGQIWRLVTPIFIHMGVLHLVFNAFWVRDLGAQIEQNRGTLFMLMLVLTSAVISNLAQFWWDGPFFGGLSGVVYALFGYVWIKGKYEPHLGLGVSRQTAMFMIGWMIFCMIVPGMQVANAAHVVGFIAGVAVGYAPIELRKLRRRLKS